MPGPVRDFARDPGRDVFHHPGGVFCSGPETGTSAALRFSHALLRQSAFDERERLRHLISVGAISANALRNNCVRAAWIVDFFQFEIELSNLRLHLFGHQLPLSFVVSSRDEPVPAFVGEALSVCARLPKLKYELEKYQVSEDLVLTF